MQGVGEWRAGDTQRQREDRGFQVGKTAAVGETMASHRGGPL